MRVIAMRRQLPPSRYGARGERRLFRCRRRCSFERLMLPLYVTCVGAVWRRISLKFFSTRAYH